MNPDGNPADMPNASPMPSTEEGSHPPEAPSRLSFTTERFLNIFAAATVLTIPAFLVFAIGYLIDNTPTLIAGTIMFLIAFTAWWIAYTLMAYWLLKISWNKIVRLATIKRYGKPKPDNK